MTDSAREQFLAGERPDDVVLYFADEVLTDAGALEEHGEPVEGGLVLVLPGEEGRSVFHTATGMDAMDFAGRAMGTEGRVDRDLTGGACPEAEGAGEGDEDETGDDEEDHRARFVLAFAEERNEEVGGRYAEGDVVHAYVHCTCGAAYSDRWVAGERAD